MYVLPQDESLIKANVFHKDCPARYLLNIVSDKWSLLIIDLLGDDSMRNGELIRSIEGISQKMLTQTLRKLADLKIVERHDLKTIPPHVEYKLTSVGLSLRDKVCALDRWVEQNMMEILPADKVDFIDNEI